VCGVERKKQEKQEKRKKENKERKSGAFINLARSTAVDVIWLCTA
jgi:hypothetical protein